eukprot:Clim_evm4s170 gene=Clim_evmTU4s170
MAASKTFSTALVGLTIAGSALAAITPAQINETCSVTDASGTMISWACADGLECNLDICMPKVVGGACPKDYSVCGFVEPMECCPDSEFYFCGVESHPETNSSCFRRPVLNGKCDDKNGGAVLPCQPGLNCVFYCEGGKCSGSTTDTADGICKPNGQCLDETDFCKNDTDCCGDLVCKTSHDNNKIKICSSK